MREVILADRNELVREGIAALLEQMPGCVVVAKLSNGRELLEGIERLRPDVAVVDAGLAELNGLDSASLISRRGFPLIIILMLGHPGEVPLIEMVNAGISGCVLKCGPTADLERAVNHSSHSSFYIGGEFLEMRAGSRVHMHQHNNRHGHLTDREREILQLIGEGNSSKEIANKLNISTTTVKTHREHLMDKLEVREIAGLTRESIRLNLVRVDHQRSRNTI
jgi:DNA-binding NarL/FixJ family response regulator